MTLPPPFELDTTITQDNLTPRVAANETDIDSLQAGAITATGERDALQADVADLQARVAALEGAGPVETDPVETLQGPILLDTDGAILENVKVTNPGGEGIRVTADDVTLRNVEVFDCAGYGIVAEGAANLTTDRPYIHDLADGAKAIYALNCSDVDVTNGIFLNAGRNFVQFNQVLRGSIVDCAGQNPLGASSAEDFISIFKSNGVAGNPILVSGNVLRGGGPSGSGSGIMVGDGGGSHIRVENNDLIRPGQVGLGVAGGTNIVVTGNRIYSDAQPWSNIGLYVWNQSTFPCNNIEVSNNIIDWLNAEGGRNTKWNQGSCGNVSGWDTNIVEDLSSLVLGVVPGE